MSNPEEQWKRLVEVFFNLKKITLRLEEIDDEKKTILQPTLEAKCALDHIMRAKSFELGIVSNKKDTYVSENFDKALGHLYRGFFDAADWAGILLRKRIKIAIGIYSNECITGVIPEYYKVMRSEIETSSRMIEELRNNKDISGDNHVLFEEMQKYYVVIEKLMEIESKVFASIPSLEEFASRERKEGNRKVMMTAAIGLICAAVGVLITYLII